MFILFFVLWIIFNGAITLEICLFGLGISAALCWFIWKVMGYELKNDLKFWKRFWGMLRFAGLLVVEICKSCFTLVNFILDFKREVRPQLVRFSPEVHKDKAKAALADAITLTPGTITVDAGEEGFLVHALDASLAEGIEESSFVRQLEKLEG